MTGSRVRRWLGLTVVATTLAAIPSVPAAAASVPNAQPFSGVGAVGALFTRGAHNTLGQHFCTASVVNSPGGDLVITAAHCLDGRNPQRIAFVPGYDAGREPYGVWLVRKVVRVSPRVLAAAPDDDIAFLLVGMAGAKRTLQSMTGAEGLGEPSSRQRVLTIGYPDGQSRPVGCVNVIRDTGRAPVEFDCGGYTGGTSGGPLIAAFSPVTGIGVIVGVIGGYEQGGYSAAVSYTPRFGRQVEALYAEATTPGVAHKPAHRPHARRHHARRHHRRRHRRG
jgi:V8-like Glu-specific endopeptidase